MLFGWLKKYIPRSLYGRAALILMVPIVSIQLVVSVVFIQRHFNSITEQMTGALAGELSYLTAQVNASDTLDTARGEIATLSPALAVEARLPGDMDIVDARRLDDLTGRLVTRMLYANVPGLQAVDLASVRGRVQLAVMTEHGPMRLSFNRSRLSASNPHQLLVLMVLFGALMTVISYLFLRNQLRPIKRLAFAAEAFGKGQVLPYHLAGATEVRSAGRAFLAMRDRIERHIEQRTLMLSGVSHDLRTPLTRLKLGLSMLEDSKERRELQGDIDDMQRLVDEFLSFARLGAQNGDPVPTNPAELLRGLAENASRAGQVVEIGTLASTGKVLLRPAQVARALENLLGNANRYGTATRISLEATPHNICFVVEDNGPGIPPDSYDAAQRPFVRLDKARNQDGGAGVGLGLAIATDIARLHGGKVVLGVSDDLGGLRVELRLPR